MKPIPDTVDNFRSEIEAMEVPLHEIVGILRSVDELQQKFEPIEHNHKIKMIRGKLEDDSRTCKVCGKSMFKYGITTMCSVKCNQTYLLSKLTETHQKFEVGIFKLMANIESKVNKLVSQISKLRSLVSEYRTLLADAADKVIKSIEETIKYSILYVEKSINRLAATVQEFLADLFKQCMGFLKTLSNPLVDALMAPMKAIESAAQAILDSFHVAYNAAYKALVSVPVMGIEEHSINFLMTLKSRVFIPQGIVNKIKANGSTDNSAIAVSYTSKALGLIDSAFPRIKMSDRMEKPSVFSSLLRASQSNMSKVIKFVETLHPITTMIHEPLPKYENLKVSNIKYSLWVMTQWGPFGKKHWGMPIP